MIFGKRAAQRILGLPGNPVSSLVCAELFLRPLIAAFGGQTYRPDIRDARLGAPMRKNDERRDYVRAIASGEGHELIATPFEKQDSSHLSAYAAANCLLIREPGAPAANPGDTCRIRMLRN